MNFSSKERIESKACEGVAFTVRRLTEGRRIQLSLKLASAYDKIDTLRREAAPIAERVKPLVHKAGAAAEAGDRDALRDLNRHPDMIEAARLHQRIQSVERDEILPVYVRVLLASVEGLAIDGKPATPEAAIEDGPRELYEEIAAVVKRELGLSEDEQGNSEPPITSTAQEDGRAAITSAEPANSEAISTAADAANTGR